MQAGQCCGQAFVVSGEPAEAGSPCERALNHPAPWQKYEAAFRFGQLDHLQCNAVRLRRLGRPLAGIALVHVAEFDVVACGGLDGLGQATDFGEVIGIGRRHVQRQQVAKRVHGRMDL